MKNIFFTMNLFFLLSIGVLQAQEIIINEYQSSNETTITDYEGDSPDWVELYNLLDSTINLQGWFLSDDPLNRFKWQFPDILFTSEELMIIFASDKDTVFPNGEIHSNFKLGNGNEAVFLSRPDSSICDFTGVTEITTDWSYGRYPDASEGWFYFPTPTPGDFNTTEPIADFADPPEFSHEAGFYTEPFYLDISPQNPGDTIYYTLDGSTPTRNSLIYSDSLFMDNKANSPNNLSLIRTTLPGFHWDPPTGVVYKYNVVRARVIQANAYPSKIISGSFIVDSLVNSKFIYPVVSLITDSTNFFDDSTGIYKAGVGIDSTDWNSAHFSQRGRD